MARVFVNLLAIFTLFGTSALASENLRKLSGWDELADLAQDKIVLFGDVHSKKGAGDTMVSYLQYLGKTDKSVLIGMEIYPREQGRLDAFMASDGSEAAITSLLMDSVFWEAPGAHDGRANSSWLNVIKTARDMRAKGHTVSLFSIEHFKPGVNWDGPSAKIFMHEMNIGSFDTAVVLAGNAHTMQSQTPLGLDFPFAHYLGSQNVISLNPNRSPAPSDFRMPNCPDENGNFMGIYLRDDVFAINDAKTYDGVFCANMLRSPYASPKTEAAYKKRLGRD